jgi:hypothetical protein
LWEEGLSAKPVKSGKTAQQEKMEAGNKEAAGKSLKGDERETFMSIYLIQQLRTIHEILSQKCSIQL